MNNQLFLVFRCQARARGLFGAFKARLFEWLESRVEDGFEVGTDQLAPAITPPGSFCAYALLSPCVKPLGLLGAQISRRSRCLILEPFLVPELGSWGRWRWSQLGK